MGQVEWELSAAVDNSTNGPSALLKEPAWSASAGWRFMLAIQFPEVARGCSDLRRITPFGSSTDP